MSKYILNNESRVQLRHLLNDIMLDAKGDVDLDNLEQVSKYKELLEATENIRRFLTCMDEVEKRLEGIID